MGISAKKLDLDKTHFIHAELQYGNSRTFGEMESFYQEREQWCIDNLKGEFLHSVVGGHFLNESDAVLFKLRWS